MHFTLCMFFVMPWLWNSRCSVGVQLAFSALPVPVLLSMVFSTETPFCNSNKTFQGSRRTFSGEESPILSLPTLQALLQVYFFFTWQCTSLSELKQCSDKLCKSVFDGSSKRFHIKCFLKYSVPTSPLKYVIISQKCTSVVLWIFETHMKVFSEGPFRVNLSPRY